MGLRSEKKKAHRRAIEILEEFASFCGGETPDEEIIGVRWIEMPPWRDKLPRGTLGPWFGPTMSQYHKAIQEHQNKSYAGGLWDPEEAYQHECVSLVTGEVVTSRPPPVGARYDYEDMARYITRNSVDLPLRELEVYYLHWRDGLSAKRVATKLELTEKNIENIILRLRGRMKKWRDR